MKINQNRKPDTHTSAYGTFRVMLVGLIVMLMAAFCCAAYFTRKMKQVSKVDEHIYEVYEKHYAFITDNTERKFWDEVYAAATEEAEKENVYVERLGDNLSADYSTKDLLRVAIHSSVDGIIFCGEDDEETVKLIDEAVEKGIAVVSLRQDVDDSDRQCFVGVNSYDLGLEYGKQILEIAELEQIRNPRVYILLDDTMTESKQNLITLAIRDSFSAESTGEENLPEIEIRRIDTSDAFSAEEAIRDIFIDKQHLPDIMVCLNSIYTQCTYQAAVDYNRVGDVKILGYYSTSSILDAVEKQIIYSTVQVDTEEMGKQSVSALTEYAETGYTSSYIPISTRVIGKVEAGRLLREAEESENADK